MKKIILLGSILVILGFTFSCESASSSPTESYKRLYAAVKAKDTEAIKAAVTKKSQDLAEMQASRSNVPIEKVFENGFTATTFATELPEIRDERIEGDMGAIEVWNSKESKWEDLPYVKEEGSWRLAVGELFAGTFKSPGPGRDRLEKEAANAAGTGMAPIPMNVNTNGMANIKPIKPPREQPANLTEKK